MEKRWTDKNVDLSLLTTEIGEYLKQQDFEAIKGETPEGGYQIFAGNSPYYRLQGYVSVNIEGTPEDFTVKLELYNQGDHPFRRPSMIETMFLSGFFSLRKIKSRDAWLKLEKELWPRIDSLVSRLVGSCERNSTTTK